MSSLVPVFDFSTHHIFIEFICLLSLPGTVLDTAWYNGKNHDYGPTPPRMASPKPPESLILDSTIALALCIKEMVEPL